MSVDTYSVCLSLCKKIRATLKILSVYLCVQIYVVYISFLLFTTVQKKKKTSKRFSSKEERLQATHHFSVCLYIISRGQQQCQACVFCPLAVVTESPGQNVLDPAK